MAALLRKALTQTALSVNGKHGIQFIRLASRKLFFFSLSQISMNPILSTLKALSIT